MGAAAFSVPNYTSDLGSAYALKIDASMQALARAGSRFNPSQQASGSPAPNMTVAIDAGFTFTSGVLLSKAAQTVSGFTAPASGTRIDRICINRVTGDALLVTGTAVAGSPSAVAPAVPAGHWPCAKVTIASTDTAIVNSMIEDERDFGGADDYVRIEDWITYAAAATQSLLVPPQAAGAKAVRWRILRGVVSVDGSYLLGRTTPDHGASFDSGAANYSWVIDDSTGAGGPASQSSEADTSFQLTRNAASDSIDNGATSAFNGFIELVDPSNTTYYPELHSEFNWTREPSAAGIGMSKGTGRRIAAARVDGVQVRPDTGTVAFVAAAFALF